MSENPPGWYRDPAEPTTQRYWDGDGWIGDPLPVDATPPDGPPAGKAPDPAPPAGPASPGAIPPGAMPPGAMPPGMPPPGAYPPGAYPPGPYTPGSYPPGPYPPGAYPPGPYQPGPYQPPGPYPPPGSVPPGTYPPAAYQPGQMPPGAIYPPGSPASSPPATTSGAPTSPGSAPPPADAPTTGGHGAPRPGSLPPGSLPPGSLPPGSPPPGSLPPGAMPPGAMPPGMYPPGWPPNQPYTHGPYVLVPEPRPHGFALATLGRRFAARMIDIAAVLVLTVLADGVLIYRFVQEIRPYWVAAWRYSTSGAKGPAPTAPSSSTWLLAIIVVAMLVWLVYEVPATGNSGQTLGKRLLGIRVISLEGTERLGFGRALVRWLPMGLPMLAWFCLFGFILQFFDALSPVFNKPLRLAQHDRFAATVVVSATKPEPTESSFPVTGGAA